MKIAIIPARGGSKRIPRKNIKEFYGKPMIAWSIEVAQESNLFEHIIVSTDDMEIAEIAQAYGAEVPFIRPNELSNDHSGTSEVIAHATQWALDEGLLLSSVCCIYATAPFIHVDDLKKGLVALDSGKWSYAFSVAEYSSTIFRAFTKIQGGGLEMSFPEYSMSRSQDLPVAFYDAGQFYWGRPSAWIQGKEAFGHESIPIDIPRWRVLDIDTPEDWQHAEILAPVILSKID